MNNLQIRLRWFEFDPRPQKSKKNLGPLNMVRGGVGIAPCRSKRLGKFFYLSVHVPKSLRHRGSARAALTHRCIRAALCCGRCGREAALARVQREERMTAVKGNADIYRPYRQRGYFVAPDPLQAARPVAKESLERYPLTVALCRAWKGKVIGQPAFVVPRALDSNSNSML